MSATPYTVASLKVPRRVLIGAAMTLDLTLVSATGAAVVPTTATLTVYDSGTILATPAVTIALDGGMTAPLLAADTDGVQSGDDLIEVWVLTIAGQTYTIKLQGMFVVMFLTPLLVDADIDPGMYPGLLDRTQYDDFSTYRATAWDNCLRWLIRQGKFFDRIVNPSDVFEVHRAWTCELIFAAMLSSTQDSEYWDARANKPRGQAERELAQATLPVVYLATDTATTVEKTGAEGPTWLNQPPYDSWVNSWLEGDLWIG